MREMWTLSGTLWGILLIIVGILVVLKTVFNLSIPVFRVAVGLGLVFIGLSILLGGPYIHSRKGLILFDERTTVVTEDQDECNIIFSSGVVDLTRAPLYKIRRYKVNTVFGSGTILIDDEIPVEVRANSAFGSVSLPDGNTLTFGDCIYRTGAFKDSSEALILEVSAVFGRVVVITR